ncbi:DEAD/H associated domain protein [Rhodomicrobium vannielii ATCC 17100]|uniref:DEAD/H associated domain protein n=1 Tax=Rhodomicrobium vannielii (strain ATCC 17100 / DSM 162 / LMG 4299 / NCIMB 10020 / ATH 3.1.1) TaxID=648757 RepID=E3I222_RHOVT|nr:ligase-associated DNA damage response DEXH box helicase [Rhodomicrobium vannielii]ADP71323.1 DEAD/H associated domain protein [Rhodomicrobium vannielii ATCC 17100]
MAKRRTSENLQEANPRDGASGDDGEHVLPSYVEAWFAARGWTARPWQRAMVEAFRERRSTLLIAPTGGGKTLSGFLPSLIDIHETRSQGIHTLYISPLKALTNDIERNLMRPIAEMDLAVSVESRTGDTPQSKRARQRRAPPNLFLTTPESLMLMLSSPDAERLFAGLRAVIVDEVHSFAATKRGDFTALALSRLAALAPQAVRFGLSATVADPAALAAWLGPVGVPAALLQSGLPMDPDIRLLVPEETRMPYGGFMARYAVPEIYDAIRRAGTSIVFVNTRAQAELMLQMLWDANEENLPIAVYHGSLSREQRRKAEAMMAAGKIRSVVATAALELGIDWGDVDLVIQVAAPKGVSRLLQRVGRSNHRLDEPSRAFLVPANRFEALECRAALTAIEKGQLDGEAPGPGSLDVVAQHILSCACSGPIDPAALFHEVRTALPYADLPRETFDRLFQFAIDGGYVLRAYDRYKRLTALPNGRFRIANPHVARRHRQNIGVIVEAARLRVMRLSGKGRGGRVLGEVEEYFAQGLTPGDTFFFAGELLAFVGVRDMTLEARPAAGGEPKVPAYSGGQMPLSTFLADGVRDLLADPAQWSTLPPDVREWLDLQARFSAIPRADRLLVEHFLEGRFYRTVFYTFAGRRANQTLGMLITRRMEHLGLKPISFQITDYGLVVSHIAPATSDHVAQFLAPDILGDELEEWILESPMLKRSFRHVATVTGLVEQQNNAARKSMRQMTISTDLIYDVLRRHEPDHILLKVTRRDAERELLDLKRLSELLTRYRDRFLFIELSRASPFSIPVLTDVRTEQVRGSGVEHLLAQAAIMHDAEDMMEEVRAAVAGRVLH